MQADVEARSDIECCGQRLPTDRALLRDLHETSEGDLIGEGTVVELVGFLIKGKFSNIGDGESVNCHFGGREENDVHLNIVRTKPPANPTTAQLQALECESVVAEISPHFRPELWEPLGRLVKTSPNATAAKKIAALDLRRPMRFTGQMFFDASHRPCVNGTPVESSRRLSAWEIHPVYAVDICINTSLSGCPRSDAGRWVPLHEWLAEEDDASN